MDEDTRTFLLHIIRLITLQEFEATLHLHVQASSLAACLRRMLSSFIALLLQYPNACICVLAIWTKEKNTRYIPMKCIYIRLLFRHSSQLSHSHSKLILQVRPFSFFSGCCYCSISIFIRSSIEHTVRDSVHVYWAKISLPAQISHDIYTARKILLELTLIHFFLIQFRVI